MSQLPARMVLVWYMIEGVEGIDFGYRIEKEWLFVAGWRLLDIIANKIKVAYLSLDLGIRSSL